MPLKQNSPFFPRMNSCGLFAQLGIYLGGKCWQTFPALAWPGNKQRCASGRHLYRTGKGKGLVVCENRPFTCLQGRREPRSDATTLFLGTTDVLFLPGSGSDPPTPSTQPLPPTAFFSLTATCVAAVEDGRRTWRDVLEAQTIR